MRLAVAKSPDHKSPREWAEKIRGLGCSACVFPLNCYAKDNDINAYADMAKEYDICIAEVGIWNNPIDRNKTKAAENIDYAVRQLQLADNINALCAVNIAGSMGEVWDGGYKENYSRDAFKITTESVNYIIDRAKPKNTAYTLEPMPWMFPETPERYIELIEAVNSPYFAVHLDVINMISSPEKYFNNVEFTEKCFKLLSPYIKSCHVKDVRLESFLTFNLKECSVGEGGFDILRYAELCEETRADMPFVIEHLNTDEEYAKAAEYVKELLKGSKVILK